MAEMRVVPAPCVAVLPGRRRSGGPAAISRSAAPTSGLRPDKPFRHPEGFVNSWGLLWAASMNAIDVGARPPQCSLKGC